jgi:hypothetical protein
MDLERSAAYKRRRATASPSGSSNDDML